jgi:deazaflavin-dependent oxidoreductase (nitroreductase family)
MSRRTVFWVLLPTAILALCATGFVKLVLVHEAARARLFPVLRPLYKRTNPGNIRAVERGQSRWAVVHHVGRRSGKRYDTPIDAQLIANGVVICLVYGAGADWCRNIVAAGGCTLTTNGRELRLNAPMVITMEAAAPLLSPERARFWRTIGIEHCLRLNTAG